MSSFDRSFIRFPSTPTGILSLEISSECTHEAITTLDSGNGKHPRNLRRRRHVGDLAPMAPSPLRGYDEHTYLPSQVGGPPSLLSCWTQCWRRRRRQKSIDYDMRMEIEVASLGHDASGPLDTWVRWIGRVPLGLLDGVTSYFTEGRLTKANAARSSSSRLKRLGIAGKKTKAGSEGGSMWTRIEFTAADHGWLAQTVSNIV